MWPYLKFASDAALEAWQDCVPNALSLEFFIFNTLQQLLETDLMNEVMPFVDKPGCLITPHRLLDILVGIIHATEYRLDADA